MRFPSNSASRSKTDRNPPMLRTVHRQGGDRYESDRSRSGQHHPLKRRSPLLLFLLLLLWSVILGIGLAQAQTSAPTATIAQAIMPDPAGLVDPVAADHQLGQELYLENCATCHVGLPPAVLPTESWREILTKPYHYGANITPLTQPALQVEWNYVSFYSRPLKEGENIPFRLKSSRYFKVLHPKVDFPEPVTVRSCIVCHPAAAQFNYRSLMPEWENAP